MLQGIECESLSANLILEHHLLFSESEKDKLNGTERNWRVCVDVVEGAMKRNPIKVLCAFYKALMNTKDSGGAAQHARIAERLTFRRCLSPCTCAPVHHICASINVHLFGLCMHACESGIYACYILLFGLHD